MNVIGFDPGYGLVGWGVVSTAGAGRNQIKAVDYGVISTPATLSFPLRLAQIQSETEELLAKFRPDVAVIEKLFLKKNVKTAAEVYQARGVLLAAAVNSGCQLFELSPNQIKLMVCGHGRAQKSEISIMVRRLLGITVEIKPDDTTDALAGAIAGCAHLQTERIFSRMGEKVK